MEYGTRVACLSEATSFQRVEFGKPMSTQVNLAFALLLTLLLGGCELLAPEDRPADGFEVNTIKDFRDAEWGSGTFYQASEQTGLRAASLEEVKDLLRAVQAHGARVEAAWFKEHRPSCGTPYGIAMQAVVPTQLVVRLSRPR